MNRGFVPHMEIFPPARRQLLVKIDWIYGMKSTGLSRRSSGDICIDKSTYMHYNIVEVKYASFNDNQT